MIYMYYMIYGVYNIILHMEYGDVLSYQLSNPDIELLGIRPPHPSDEVGIQMATSTKIQGSLRPWLFFSSFMLQRSRFFFLYYYLNVFSKGRCEGVELE